MADLAVLVVSYRRADLLLRCLDSVARWLPRASVHVWDNRSPGTPDVCRAAQGRRDVDWCFSDANIGFASAVNALVARTTTEHLLLLNPDAELLGPLRATLQCLDADPSLAAAAPCAAAPDGRPAWDNAHRPPTLVRQLVSFAGYADRLDHPWLSDLYPTPPTGPVGYLTGSCLVVTRRAWDDVGPFDERYFLYGEEVDWALRARRAGWSLRLVEEIGFRHSSGGTVADDPTQRRRSSVLLRQSQVRYLTDHAGGLAGRSYAMTTTLLDRVQRSKRAERSRRSGP